MHADLRHPLNSGMRKQTANNPSATIDIWIVATHFLMRSFKSVSTEISFYVFNYNLKRVLLTWAAKG